MKKLITIFVVSFVLGAFFFESSSVLAADERFESATIIKSSNLSISSAEYSYTESSDDIEQEFLEGNDYRGCIQCLVTANGPSTVRSVVIAGWLDTMWTDDEINHTTDIMLSQWRSRRLTSTKVLPYTFKTLFTLTSNDLDKKLYVLLAGLDANGDVVGTSVIQVVTPESAGAIKGAVVSTGEKQVDAQDKNIASPFTSGGSGDVIDISPLTDDSLHNFKNETTYIASGKRNVVSINYVTAAAIKEDNSLWMWGQNSNYELGTDDGDYSYTDSYGLKKWQSTPVKVMDDVIGISSNEYATNMAVIRSDGSLWVWGWVNHKTIPAKIMENVISVSCGSEHAAAIKSDGSLWMWGSNSRGQLATGDSKEYTEPTKVMNNVVAVSCGRAHTAVIKTDGSLWTWGLNVSGVIGKGDTGPTYIPVKMMDDAVAVCCDFDTTAAIKKDGSLWVWGAYICEPSYENKSSPDPIKIMDDVASVDMDESTMTVLKTDGSLWGIKAISKWNAGYFGGAGDEATAAGVPVKIMDEVVDFCTSGFASIVVKSNGSLWVWGQHLAKWHGGSWIPTSVPVKVMEGVTTSVSFAADSQPSTVSKALSVVVDGDPIVWNDAEPFIDKNNRTMVPLRAVGNALGLTVDWDGNKREAIFSNGKKTLYFPIDSTVARTSDGDTIKMNTAAVVISGRTYAPVRYLAEYFGYSVGWDGGSKTVTIKRVAQ